MQTAFFQESPMSSNLALKLRAGTQKAHTAAENVGFMKCFLKGVVDRATFSQFLSNLYFVYRTLEAGLEQHKNHPVVGKIYFPELWRTASLEQDLRFHLGENWHLEIVPTSAAQNYIKRLETITQEQPLFLIAHAYTRYLGDLSGGQMLQKLAQSALNLTGNQGTNFYYFPQIPDKKGFKQNFRQVLNETDLDEETVNQIVEEAVYAFQLNIQMSQSLEGNLIKSLGKIVFNSLTRSKNNPGST